MEEMGGSFDCRLGPIGTEPHRLGANNKGKEPPVTVSVIVQSISLSQNQLDRRLCRKSS
jgi:hypothetical protein